jgi:biopolymer transport protein ExbD
MPVTDPAGDPHSGARRPIRIRDRLKAAEFVEGKAPHGGMSFAISETGSEKMKSPRLWKFMASSDRVTRPRKRGLFSSIPFQFFWMRRARRRPNLIWWGLWQFVFIVIFFRLITFLIMSFPDSGSTPNFMDHNLPMKVNLPVACLTDEPRVGTPLVLIGDGQVALMDPAMEVACETTVDDHDFPDALVLGLEELGREVAKPHSSKPAPGIVTIAADRDVPFSHLRLVMDACRAAGYNTMDLAVTPGEDVPGNVLHGPGATW